MSDYPVGISTGSFYRQSFFDCITAIVESGFSMIEICSSPYHLDYHDMDAVARAARLLTDLGIEAYSFHAPFADDIDITALDPAVRGRAENEMKQAARAAATLRVRHFVIHPGPEKSRAPEPAERMIRLMNGARVLERVAAFCRDEGVGFVLENMLPHLMFGNLPDMLWMMGALTEMRVGACLDTGHARLAGDVYRVMYKLSGHLQLIHASDNYGNRDDHLPPGKGTIDWGRVLAAAGRMGFHGGIILELAGHEDVPNQQRLREARAARWYLRDIMRRLDLHTPPTVENATEWRGDDTSVVE